jgi:glycerophosphoryl diester phosphodiesterase
VENSLAAFRAARRLGADAVELDVHSTADGALVVHHDELIGRRRIGDMALVEVRAHKLPNGEPVPTLEATLAAILPDLYAYVEIKTLEPRWDPVLLATFDASVAPARIAVHAFDHRIIHRLGKLRPKLPRGVLLSSYPMNPVQLLKDADATTLWERYNHVDRALVETVHASGGQVIAWTADDPAEIGRLLGLGVDGVCSNHPDRVRLAVDSAS